MEISPEPRTNFTKGKKGAVYDPLHTKRSVIIYPIQEHEIELLASYNTNSAIWCSIGSAITSLLAGSVWDMIQSGTCPNAGSVALAAITLVASIASFVIAYKNNSWRSACMARIREETKSIEI